MNLIVRAVTRSKFFYVSAFELGYKYFNIIINIIVL